MVLPEILLLVLQSYMWKSQEISGSTVSLGNLLTSSMLGAEEQQKGLSWRQIPCSPCLHCIIKAVGAIEVLLSRVNK